ncbi:MAG: type III pantothenate kinase [Planctomycetia bacterium]|nr:type III pantothenate kinase [Planctomycetia bacterium]
MANSQSFPLVAVDVGNCRIKLGDFEHPLAEPLPHPVRALAIDLDWAEGDFDGWLPHDPAKYTWSIASVNRPAAKRLVQWLQARKVPRIQLLTDADLPLEIDLPRSDLVGLDRLANAVAANRLRSENQPAIIIDIGSAITVDLIAQNGAFVGGAILPGLGMSARALHELTDLLPLVDVTERPEPLGKSTLAAINSGLFWGTVGAVREVMVRLAEGPTEVQVFLTGGGAPLFAVVLGEVSPGPIEFVPHLTLAGIALTALGTTANKESR